MDSYNKIMCDIKQKQKNKENSFKKPSGYKNINTTVYK